MSDHSIPFDPDTPCDDCGTMGAFDFMGDYLCMKCSDGEKPLWAIDKNQSDDDHFIAEYMGWWADVARYAGRVVISHPIGGRLWFYDINAIIARLEALRDLAKEHFGEDWGK